MGKQSIAVIACVVVIGLLASCGGGGDANTTSSVSKAQFVKEANVVCEKAGERLQRDYLSFVKQHASVTKATKAEYAELVSTVFVPNIEQEVTELRSLGAPSGDEQKIKAFIDARQESIQIAERNPRMLLTEGEKVTARSTQIAKEYGLESCGRS